MIGSIIIFLLGILIATKMEDSYGAMIAGVIGFVLAFLFFLLWVDAKQYMGPEGQEKLKKENDAINDAVGKYGSITYWDDHDKK